jgi:hypothetical protein
VVRERVRGCGVRLAFASQLGSGCKTVEGTGKLSQVAVKENQKLVKVYKKTSFQMSLNLGKTLKPQPGSMSQPHPS